MSRRQRGTGSVFRPEGSSVWWVQYYQNGVRQRESAGTADRREALDVLKRRVAEVNTGNVAGTRFVTALMWEFHGDLRLVVAAYYAGDHGIAREQLNYHNPDVVAYVLAVRRQFMIRKYAAVRPPRRSTP
jgi:hypothetical protein